MCASIVSLRKAKLPSGSCIGFLFLIGILSACAKGGLFSSSFGKESNTKVNEESEFDVVESEKAKDTKVVSFSNLKKLATSEFVDRSLANATHEDIIYEGYTITDPLDYLLKYEQDLRSWSDEFSTVGDYLETYGIYSIEDVDPNLVEKGLQITEKVTFDEDRKSIDKSDANSSTLKILQLQVEARDGKRSEQVVPVAVASGTTSNLKNKAFFSPVGATNSSTQRNRSDDNKNASNGQSSSKKDNGHREASEENS